MKREAALFTIALALGTTMLVPRTDAQAPATNAAGLSFTTIDVPFSGVSETQAIGINNRGQIVGFYNDSTGMHGFVDDNGRFDAINVPIPGAIGTELDGVNHRGQIVGNYTTSGGLEHGFLDDRGAFSSIVAPFPGTVGTLAFEINDKGQIVGI
jgi:uncharacterized membrane protein